MRIARNDACRWTSRLAGRRLLDSPKMIFMLGMTVFMALFFLGSISALAQKPDSQEEEPTAQLGEDVTPMDQSFQEKPGYPRLFPWLKEKLKDAPPFFRDSKLDLNVRTFDFSRNKFDHSNSEAWALGGSLSYRSGWFLDRFGMGSALYTSHPLDAPDDKDGTLLLKPGQEEYTVVGQLFGRVKLNDNNFINLYRYEYNTPYMNKKDVRMSPYTFEGYTLTGMWKDKVNGTKFNYGGGYIEKIKPLNEDKFISMSNAAGADVDRGVVVGGANAVFGDFSLGAIDYYSEDIINIGYTEAKFNRKLTDRLAFILSAQFTDQRSVGDDLLKDYSFETNQPGVKTDLTYGKGIFTLAYTSASRGANLQAPWSTYPGYTSVQVQEFNRAGEEAFMVKGAYDLSKFNLEGVTAYALWVHGWGAVDPITKEDVFDQDEYNYDLQWIPKTTFLKGLWFRIRYAHTKQRDKGHEDMDDFRFIVNYDQALL